jgi:hypothetical protein
MRLLVVVLAVVVAACATPRVLTPSPMAGPGSTPTPPPVEPAHLEGSGTQKTEPFDLPGGSFTVTITGLADGDVRAQLFPVGGNFLSGTLLFNTIAHGPYSYQTSVGPDAGSYFLDVIVDGDWTVRFFRTE